MKERTIAAFDFLVVAFLNVGYFFGKSKNDPPELGRHDPEFFKFPAAFIRQHHNATSSWEKVRTRGLDIESYRGDRGFEQVAQLLKIPYPSKASVSLCNRRCAGGSCARR